jgi:hypothetical protein
MKVRHIPISELLEIWDKSDNEARSEILTYGLNAGGDFKPNDRESILCGIWKYQNKKEGRIL